MIQLTDIRKSYGKNAVLKGVSLHIEEGEFISIIGQSGSGKSTLLNIIGALDLDFEGKAIVASQDVRGMTDRQVSVFRNTCIGFVFQSFHLLPHLPCGQNVALPAYFNHRMNEDEIIKRVDGTLERVGLLHKKDEFPLHLSGGERQRIAIARALFNDPKIILCDEPTGALDTGTGSQIMELFQTLNRDMNVTLVIVTHERTVSERADRIIKIEDGLIVTPPTSKQEEEA